MGKNPTSHRIVDVKCPSHETEQRIRPEHDGAKPDLGAGDGIPNLEPAFPTEHGIQTDPEPEDDDGRRDEP